ncbi:flagellar hook-length control protein FliK [Thiobacter aerophilum]|uniref:Flagellar hook-length control protein FliK n=1 Tax=Thiobacter aerophilum TaxID=3121275 RepID=A0ABV0EB24_9BURK
MPNMPVSSHITVIAVAPPVAEQPANQPAATDGALFASLLARQLAQDAVPLSPPIAEARAEGAQVTDDSGTVAGSVPSTTDPAAALPTLPLMPLVSATSQLAPTAGRQDNLPRTGTSKAERAGDAPASLPPVLPQVDAKPAKVADEPFLLPAGVNMAKDAVGARNLDSLDAPASRLAEATPQPLAAWHAQGVAPSRGEIMPAAAVQQPVGSPGWGGEFAQKVVWLNHQGQQFAQIQVTPPQLGPVEIHLSLGQDQANMTFVSPHAPVREAIEAALPRLREMLAESGIQLGNVEVASHSFGQGPRQDGEPGLHQGSHASVAPVLTPARATPAWRGAGREGLVDVFA